MNGCAWCRIVPEEHEPQLVPFVLGSVSCRICASCADEVGGSVVERMLAIKRQAEKDEQRVLQREARIRLEEEAAAARLREREEVAAARERAQDININSGRAIKRHALRVAVAKRYAGRLLRAGVSPHEASARAAVRFELEVTDLVSEERAA